LRPHSSLPLAAASTLILSAARRGFPRPIEDRSCFAARCASETSSGYDAQSPACDLLTWVIEANAFARPNAGGNP
jgi:hypothetical protein